MITPEELLRLETVGVLRNGRRRYDPASKQRLVEACLQPGVSLAGLACQSAFDWDPLSASKRDPFDRRALLVALGSSELVGVAETARARVV
ncbi:hypothetical protein ACVMGC_004167 [Bradyrhizobium barranii subsp. barranii]